MKTRTVLLLTAVAWLGMAQYASAAGTAFTYQGRLDDTGQCADGNYDFQFTLYGAQTLGSVLYNNTTPTSDVLVTNGLFTVTLDFGSGAFNGTPYWLQTGVRTNGSILPYDMLVPRQQILPTPYAIYAETAGGVPAGSITGSEIASGQVVKSLNGLEDVVTLAAGPNVTIVPSGNTLTIGAAGDNNAWLLAGNSGTSPGPNFLGTTDSQPLELHVNNQRALRLEPNVSGPFGAPNVIGGSANNSVYAGVNNAFIGGGYYNTINAANSAIVGGNQNYIADTNSFIGGGENHVIQPPADHSFIGGGNNNVISSSGAAAASYSTIGGGIQNGIVQSRNSFIGGGSSNSIYSLFSIQHGDFDSGANSTIAGGWANGIEVAAVASFIGGGQSNAILRLADHCAIGGGWNNIIGTNSGSSVIGGGGGNSISNSSAYAVIAGGNDNQILFSSEDSAINGGQNNVIQANAGWSFIGGGAGNTTFSGWSVIGGGSGNLVGTGTLGSTIGGGYNNTNNGYYGSIGGGQYNSIGASANNAAIGGGFDNIANGLVATVPGGYQNVASGNTSFAAGAYAQAVNDHAFVWSDGTGPTVSTADYQFLARAKGGFVFLTGAAMNTFTLTVNLQSGGSVTVGDTEIIELGNIISPANGVSVSYANVSGDTTNSIAMQLASAINSSPACRQLGITATSPVGSASIILTSTSAFANMTINTTVTPCEFCSNPRPEYLTPYNPAFAPVGAQLPAGSGSWSMYSDRNAKENFETVNAQTVLAEVAAIPMSTWNYKTQDKSIRHIGPMAQDFHAAFGVGENATTISTVDEGGVALAAIQGLNQKVDEKDAEIQELKARLEEVEQLMNEKVGGVK